MEQRSRSRPPGHFLPKDVGSFPVRAGEDPGSVS